MSGVRRLAVDVPPALTETRVALPLSANGVRILLKAALPEMAAAGGKVAEFGALFERWLAARPDERLHRRDAAIVALALFCDSGRSAKSPSKLLRWRAIMRQHAGGMSVRSIRRR